MDEVPENLHAMLFELRRICPTWENCLAFLNGGGFDQNRLVAFLENGAVRTALLAESVPTEPEAQPLRTFLLNAKALSNSAYLDYAEALPYPFERFPASMEPAKTRTLIGTRKITFSKASLEDIADQADLQVLFVAMNIEDFLAEPDGFAFADDFLESLLRTEISDERKASVIGLMDLDAVVGLPDRAALVGSILDRTNSGLSKLNARAARSLITHSAPIATQISIMNKVSLVLTDDDVRQVLAVLPRPYSDIRTGYYTPTLNDDPENRKLLGWLDSRNIISSWKVNKGFFSHDLRVNLRRR